MGLVAKGRYAGQHIYSQYLNYKDTLYIAPMGKDSSLRISAYVTSKECKRYELLTGDDVVRAGDYSVKIIWNNGSESILSLSTAEYRCLLNSFHFFGSNDEYNKQVKKAENESWAWKIAGIAIVAAYCLFYIFGGDW